MVVLSLSLTTQFVNERSKPKKMRLGNQLPELITGLIVSLLPYYYFVII